MALIEDTSEYVFSSSISTLVIALISKFGGSRIESRDSVIHITIEINILPKG